MKAGITAQENSAGTKPSAGVHPMEERRGERLPWTEAPPSTTPIAEEGALAAAETEIPQARRQTDTLLRSPNAITIAVLLACLVATIITAALVFYGSHIMLQLSLFGALAIFGLGGLFHILHVRALIGGQRQRLSELRSRLEELQDRTWELRESEERYRSLAEAFGDLILHRDGTGCVTYVNQAFLSVFGGEADQHVGTEFKPEFLAETDIPAKLGGPRLKEVKLKTRDGSAGLPGLI